MSNFVAGIERTAQDETKQGPETKYADLNTKILRSTEFGLTVESSVATIHTTFSNT